jgi:hypothetical protein
LWRYVDNPLVFYDLFNEPFLGYFDDVQDPSQVQL